MLMELMDGIQFWMEWNGDLQTLGWTEWSHLLDLAIPVLIVIGIWWQNRAAPKVLELSPGEILVPRHGKRALRIERSSMTEVSPLHDGVQIAWMNHGIPTYTNIPARWFPDEEWTKLYPALLKWGNHEP
jgi:hypothetical protein